MKHGTKVIVVKDIKSDHKSRNPIALKGDILLIIGKDDKESEYDYLCDKNGLHFFVKCDEIEEIE